MRLEQIYQEVILDHYKHPHHRGLREPYDAEVHHVNPTCGDEVTLRFPGGVRSYRVVALYGESPLLRNGGFILTHEAFDAAVPEANRVDQQILIRFAPSVDPAALCRW
jgi:hypothetical protein